MTAIYQRAMAYLEHMPPAIAGSGGHHATFKAAAALARGFALSEEEAWPLLQAWNQSHCHPSWTLQELRAKLRSATTSTRPLGYLLTEDHQHRDQAVTASVDDSAKKALHRRAWPKFRVPTKAEIECISRLRTLPGSALRAAIDADLLAMCQYEGTDCFALKEGDFTQVRRLDGAGLRIPGGLCKTKNLPGSAGSFLGEGLLAGSSSVLLVEGCVGLLEALGIIALADARGWTALAATSASSRFYRAPEILAKLKGRRVLIVPDADQAGLKAAATWLADLEHIGAFVTAVGLPQGCKDLGPVVSDPVTHEPFLTTLFS